MSDAITTTSGESIVGDNDLRGIVDRAFEKHESGRRSRGGDSGEARSAGRREDASQSTDDDADDAADIDMIGREEIDPDYAAATDDDGSADGDQPISSDDGTDPGDDNDASQPALADEDMRKFVTIKIGDKEERITVADALKGYSRTADYTAKTAKLSEAARNIVSEHQKNVQTARNVYQAAMIMHPVVREIAKLGNEGMAELARTDPDRYNVLQAELRVVTDDFNTINHHLTALAEKQVQADQMAEFEQFLEKRSEYKDEAKAGPLWNDMGAALRDYGFSKEEVEAIGDHRMLLVAHDAAQYRKLMKARETGRDKTPDRVPVRPGARPAQRPGGKKDLLPQSVKDAAARGDFSALLKHQFG